MSYPVVERKKTYRIGIVGASGYTGSELVRLLLNHPEVSIEIITSETHQGKLFSDLYPQFRGIANFILQPMEKLRECDVDLVFLALPHGISMKFVKEFGTDKFTIIDLSADFRITNPDVYKEWYKTDHNASEFLNEAVYGLPEINRADIRRARLIANPGCYPTSAILALLPLLKNNLIDPKSIIIDSKSGVSGAGAKPKDTTHFPEVFGNFSAYGLLTHRHTPEIEQVLSQVCDTVVSTLFTPHLLPVDRGILTTTYSVPTQDVSPADLLQLYSQFYLKEKFVRVCDTPPALKHVRGSNYFDVFVTYDKRTNKIVTVSVIDNLVKGAAGQAIQNMNIMFNLLESTALLNLPLCP
ncbi:MAG: N-acetyl-gamma-glutamyl-phosphate reductase [Calditrichae bacterium]|nr:N-acetyl-gamma-glutamyl-phosphate reductase [Calditrichia bacterium]